MHPVILEDIRFALRLSIDRRVRVLLAVALLTGQTKEIHHIETNVTRIVDRFHYEIARHSELEEHLEDPIVVMCHHGVRSLQVVAFLREAGFLDARSLAGGIDRWSLEIDGTVPRY